MAEVASMWRDPLDELIADLEGATAVTSPQNDLPDLTAMQRYAQVAWAGGEALERAKGERWYQELQVALARQAARSHQKA
jgi:hypothetical protein